MTLISNPVAWLHSVPLNKDTEDIRHILANPFRIFESLDIGMFAVMWKQYVFGFFVHLSPQSPKKHINKKTKTYEDYGSNESNVSVLNYLDLFRGMSILWNDIQYTMVYVIYRYIYINTCMVVLFSYQPLPSEEGCATAKPRCHNHQGGEELKEEPPELCVIDLGMGCSAVLPGYHRC